MKKIFLSTFLLLFLTSLSAWAKDEAPPKGLTDKEVSTEMAEVWCQKMVECAKDSNIGPIECKKLMYKNFKTGFENVPKGQQVQVTRESLDQCVSNVKKTTCVGLKGAQTISGCEFISQLGQEE